MEKITICENDENKSGNFKFGSTTLAVEFVLLLIKIGY
jgi:hypothetical protein